MDSRVQKLAAYARDNHDEVGDPDGEWVGSEEVLADNSIRVVEAAGLVVIDPDDEAAIDAIAKATAPHYWSPLFGDHARNNSRAIARDVLAALRGGA